MAWSWLRRRADRPTVPAPTAAHPPATAPVPHEGAWQDLPAVQRTLEPLSLVAPLDAFTNSLAAHQNPSFLAPLGHGVDPDSPSGLVTGLASVRAGSPVPYAASTALAVPTPSKPRPAVQRRAITWSTTTAASLAEPAAVEPVDTAPAQADVGPDPEPATDDVAVADLSEVVTSASPVSPAGPISPALPTSTGPAPRTEPHSAPSAEPDPVARAEPDPVPSGEPDPVPTEHLATKAGPGPAAAIADTEVVTPDPPAATPSGPQVAPLQGTPPATPAAREGAGEPDPQNAAPPAPLTPLPVSRLAEETGTAAPPAGRPATAAQSRASERTQPEVQRSAIPASIPTISASTPTISALTPVPSVQRHLAVVSEYPTRTGMLPPPFTVELPVVAHTGSEPAPAAEPLISTEPPPSAGLLSDGLPAGGVAAPPESSPQPAPATGFPSDGLPTAHAPSRNPAPASDPAPAAGSPTLEGFSPELAEPAAPLSGFAAHITALTNPPERSGQAGVAGALVPPPVQRLAGRAAPQTNPPALTEQGQAEDSTAADHNADQVPGPIWTVTHDPDLPLPADPPATSGHGGDLSTPAGGPGWAPGTTLPVAARLTASEPPPATPPPRPRLAIGTAELVPHRPPLAVRSELSSAVAPPPAVQRVSFPGAGEASTAPRPEAPTAVQRMPTPASPPASPEVWRRTVSGEAPANPALGTTGHAVSHLDPIPQRRSTSLPTSPAASPLATPVAGPVGYASALPPIAIPSTTGPARSFAAMFATASGEQPAAEAEEHPGYTTIQLQTDAEPAATSPPPGEPTTVPATEPPVETAAPAPATAPAASPGGAPPTAGAAAAELDEMARRLFEPLSARLRAELWLDRERAGLVTDARH